MSTGVADNCWSISTSERLELGEEPREMGSIGINGNQRASRGSFGNYPTLSRNVNQLWRVVASLS